MKEFIESGRAVLGIEFGSTRIKSVLIDDKFTPIASGEYVWENRLENGIWTYSLEDIWTGLQQSYFDLTKNVHLKYDATITNLKSIGFSAMMHGYLAFDANGKLLVPFRTWRNSITGKAADKLTEVFHYNIPQRWSIAHLYQAILNHEEHVGKIDFITTLAGYIHWKLTGKKVLGIGDASGMFPIDNKNYNKKMISKFQNLEEVQAFSWKLEEILPKVLLAGEDAGNLTKEGARLLDITGNLKEGISICPPEGDAGTGMVATNSVAKKTGNVSAGTSIFAMVVLEEQLKKVHKEIDLVTTPDGSLVGMVHANNCTSDLNAWIGLFNEVVKSFGMEIDTNKLYQTLFYKALEADVDCGGLLSYGFLSGENIMEVMEGRPLFVRTPDSKFTLANFMRTHLYAALGTLKVGMDILLKEEQVKIDSIMGHGGLFKTPLVGQKMLAAAINAPVSVMETAGEGGPWGMAILASYRAEREENETLQEYLDNKVFVKNHCTIIEPDAKDVEGFEAFMERFKAGISIEKEAIKC